MELFATMRGEYDELSFSIQLDCMLDLPKPKGAKIQKNYHSSTQRKEAYLDLYATDHPCPSWMQVVEVLRRVGLPHQADVVESTYILGIITILLMHSFCVHCYHRICY